MVKIVNERPSKYTLNASTPSLIAKHSFSTVAYCCSRGRSLRLKKLTGCSSLLSSTWLKIAPTPLLEASVCSKNGLLKSGLCRTGFEQSICFNVLKALSHLSDQGILFGTTFLVRSDSGAARDE